MILRGIRDVEQSSNLALSDVGLRAAGRQRRERELVISRRLVMLQRPDEIVAVELPRVHAERVQRERVSSQTNRRRSDFSMPEQLLTPHCQTKYMHSCALTC